jgi:hypothetical protein
LLEIRQKTPDEIVSLIHPFLKNKANPSTSSGQVLCINIDISSTYRWAMRKIALGRMKKQSQSFGFVRDSFGKGFD